MSDKDRYILTMDLGTSGPKVALFTVRGEMVACEFEETELILLPGGGAEQSPAGWWKAIGTAAKRLLAKGLVPLDQIVAIAITGQWAGTVAVDGDGHALGNSVIWMDSRGAPAISKVTGGALNIGGYSPGKLLDWIRLTGGIPSLTGKDPIAHILYIKHAHPEIHRQTWKFLEPIDYLGLLLTGRCAASFDSITLHWLTDNRNISAVKYDRRLIGLSTIDPVKLPDLLPANSILGPLIPAIAREWGLRDDVQVVMGSPDIHSAAVGSGAVRDFETHMYIGTSSWITCHVPFKKTDLLHNMAALPSAIPGRYLLTNEQECAGVCLQFLRDNIFFHPDGPSLDGRPKDVYKVFDRIAERTPAGSDKLIFTPWLYGERTPVDDHTVRGGFFNQSLKTTSEHMIRAVFEGVAYNSRWLLRYVERFIDRRSEAINIVGGGAKSETWCQVLADVMDRRLRQMRDPVEVNVRGAALLASAALGYLRYDEIGSLVEVTRTFEPNPDHRKIYDELFVEFLAIYDSNRKSYAKLNRTH